MEKNPPPTWSAEQKAAGDRVRDAWDEFFRATPARKTDDPLGGRDPYSASKAAMEIAIASFRESFFEPYGGSEWGVRLASARAGNVIGGGDWAAHRIVPDIVRALHASEAVAVRSPGGVRPWQHVLEPLSGYLALGSALSRDVLSAFTNAWNFGPNMAQTYTVTELVEAMIQSWGKGTWIANSMPNGRHEAGILRLSIDKASSLLGWRPVWSFEETVTRTVNWYLSYLAVPEDRTATYNLCAADIVAYESAACERGISWARQGIGAAVEY